MKWILILLTLVAFTSCKVRTVSLNKTHTVTDSVHTASHDSSGSIQTHTTDTSKKEIHTVVTNKDSSVTTTDLTPDSGKTITIHQDGSITGVKHIHSTKTDHKDRTKTEDTKQKAGKDSLVNQNSHTHNQDSTRVKETKDTKTKDSHSDSTLMANIKWWELILIIALLIGAFILIKKLKIL